MQQGESRLGKYQIITRLGQGGMGEVYKAFHPHLERYVAIKVLLASTQADPDFLTRFQNEARAVARLRHPHIVQVFDFDIEDERPYMVMEFVEGETLAQRMGRSHRAGQLLPLHEVLRLFSHLCSAVVYAHRAGMLHRDIKPANVIITPQNDAILTDFGIVRMGGVSGLTAGGLLIGTPRYMSPEQAQGLPVDERGDVYSLGVILYELLAGQSPFDADTPVGMALQHMMTHPLPITAANPAVPPELAEIALVAIAKNPNERFRSAEALGRAIAGAMTLPHVTSGSTPFGSPGSGPAAASADDGDQLPTGRPGDPSHQLPAPEPAAAGRESSPTEGADTPAAPLAAAETTLIALAQAPAADAMAPPLSDGGTQPSSAASGAVTRTLPGGLLPPSPPGAPGDGAAKRQPPRHLGRRLASFIPVLLLLALTSGLLVLNLVNRGHPLSPGGTGTPPPEVVVGMVTLTDSDPNDFSHLANSLSAEFTSLRPPTRGSTYVAWLCDSGATACASLGPLSVGADGSASLHVSRSGDWLQEQNPTQPATTITFEITQEHAPFSASKMRPSDQVVYSGHIPPGVLVHLRHELTDFPKQGIFQGNTTPLAMGLGKDALLLHQLSSQLQQYQAAGDLPDMQESAVYLLNLILGKTAAQDGDHDGDTNGDIAPGDDGFGLGSTAAVSHLSQGCDAEQMNYLPLVVEHACNAAAASGAPALQRLFTAIQAAGTNIATWVTQIEQIAHKVLAAQQASDVTEGDANTLVNEADEMLNGVAGDVQNQDGVRQLLLYIEQMATIAIRAV